MPQKEAPIAHRIIFRNALNNQRSGQNVTLYFWNGFCRLLQTIQHKTMSPVASLIFNTRLFILRVSSLSAQLLYPAFPFAGLLCMSHIFFLCLCAYFIYISLLHYVLSPYLHLFPDGNHYLRLGFVLSYICSRFRLPFKACFGSSRNEQRCKASQGVLTCLALISMAPPDMFPF